MSSWEYFLGGQRKIRDITLGQNNLVAFIGDEELEMDVKDGWGLNVFQDSKLALRQRGRIW